MGNMEYLPVTDRSTMITVDLKPAAGTFAEDIDRGLSDSPKHLPCMYFYDYRGSQLFERICRLPEYYLTRTEAGILEQYSDEIVSLLPENPLLVELGCGSCTKTRHIIDELLSRHERVTYCPIDISKDMLEESAAVLIESYDRLEIISVAARYKEGLKQIETRTSLPKLILWLGSSIGNFTPVEASRFLNGVTKAMSKEDSLLIGFDLEKDRSVMERAYDDPGGVTARFNLNLLKRINRELGGCFEPGRFSHRAVYNQRMSRVEMYLVSACRQEVRVEALDKTYRFGKHETIHTENSHKFSLDTIRNLADSTGLEIAGQWFDTRKYFNLSLLRPNGK
jgi:dimethylhistidine N-methyltransferase